MKTIKTVQLSHKREHLLWHVFGVSMFVLYEQGLLAFYYVIIKPVSAIAFYVVDITYFYILSYIVIPFLLRGKFKVPKIFSGIFVTGTCFVLLQLVAGVFAYWYNTNKVTLQLDEQSIKKAIARYVYMSACGIVFFIAKNGIRKAREAGEQEVKYLKSEQRRLQLENAYLQAQINPHLLFNTLNYVHHLIHKLSERASMVILLLTDIMHYALKDPNASQSVTLADELEQVDHYTTLIRLRNEGSLQLIQKTEVASELLQSRLPPLLFITCIENMFKHGDLHDSEHPARLEIYNRNNSLYITTFNRKKRTQKAGHGIGLENIKKRLERAFPNAYLLTIKEDTTFFELNLSIQL